MNKITLVILNRKNMSSITIEKPKDVMIKDSDLKILLENIIGDLNSFDVHLMNKYYETKDTPLSEMTDI